MTNESDKSQMTESVMTKTVMELLAFDIQALDGETFWNNRKATYARELILNKMDAVEMSKPAVRRVVVDLLNTPELSQAKFWLQSEAVISRRLEECIIKQTARIRLASLETIRERALTAYRAVCKLAENNDEFGDQVKDQLNGVKEAIDLAGAAELTATKRYATAVLYAEEILHLCWNDFYMGELPEDIGSDPDVSAAVDAMSEPTPWGAIDANQKNPAVEA